MSLDEIPFCDVFTPTKKEFKNFEKYVSQCVNKAKSGIIKIIPPKGWKARDSYTDLTFNVCHPIEQVVNGSSGFYEALLIQKESRSLSKYKKLVIDYDKLTDGKSVKEIEQLVFLKLTKFWKNLKLSNPLYGADSPGSLFKPGVDWNLAELDTILKRGLEENGIQGVTSPYMYAGAWKTFFAWHKEDMDLYSINYNHMGKAK